MSTLDLILIAVGVAMVALCLFGRFIKALFLLVGAYTATLSSVLSYQEVAHRMRAMGKGQPWFEGLIFLLLFVIICVVFYVVLRVAFPDTTLPKLGFLDYLLGGVVGVVVAAVVMAMLYAGVGVMVSEYWEPNKSYSQIHVLYHGASLGSLLKQFLSYYLYAFYPFFVGTRIPPVLTPP